MPVKVNSATKLARSMSQKSQSPIGRWAKDRLVALVAAIRIGVRIGNNRIGSKASPEGDLKDIAAMRIPTAAIARSVIMMISSR